MSVEFSLDYEAAVEAANTLGHSAQEFRRIAQSLNNVGQDLITRSFVGLTGQAAHAYLRHVQDHLMNMQAKATEMQQDLMETVRSFRDDIDPGTAQRFQD